MAVRAKFKVTHIAIQGSVDGEKSEEKRTIHMEPVYSNEPGSENAEYWNATPAGSIQLGTVNQAAWSQFDQGKTYYVDFTPAGE